MNPTAEFRDHLSFEPRVVLEPPNVSRAGVGQGNQTRQEIPPRLHGCRERPFPGLPTQVPVDRVTADGEGQFNGTELFEDPLPPGFGALGTRRQVTARAGARVAEAHRHDGDATGVVERVAVNAEPGSQAVAAGIVERDAGGVDLPARCLSGDEEAGSRRQADHRTRTQWKVNFAETAGPYLRLQSLQRRVGHGRQFRRDRGAAKR